MNLADLNKVAQAMVTPGKGLLAADESSGTIKKRFDVIKVEVHRGLPPRLSRDAVSFPEAMTNYISGVILYDETIWQNAKDGTPLVKLIEQAGAIPGIKVDEGTRPLPELPRRTGHRRARQARRAAEEILRARRALRQMARGDRHRRGHPDHDRDPCQRPCAGALRRPVPGRADRADRRAGSADGRRPRHRSLLRGDPARPQQDVPGTAGPARRAGRHDPEAQHGHCGKKCATQASVEEVAEKTIRLLKSCVPAAVPGIAFLSGGQSDEDATAHLDAMNRIGGLPWKLTFSYGRALQAAPQKAWSGKAENVAAGQQRLHPSRADEFARSTGEWKADLEKEGGIAWPPNRPPRPVPRLYLATPVVDDPSALVGKPSRPARRRRRRGGPGAAEADRPAHHDLAGQGAGAGGPGRRRRASARRPCRTGRPCRRRRRASDRHRRRWRMRCRSLKPDRIAGVGGLADPARFDGRGRGRRGLRAVRRARCRRDSGPRSRRSPSACNGGPNCSSRPASAMRRRCEEAREFAAAGADFVLVGDFIWADPRGAAAALIDVGQAIRQAHADNVRKSQSRTGIAPEMKILRVRIDLSMLASCLVLAASAPRRKSRWRRPARSRRRPDRRRRRKSPREDEAETAAAAKKSAPPQRRNPPPRPRRPRR